MPEREQEAAAWFFENAPDLFAIIRDGRVVSVNPAWTRISGFSAEETVGRTADDFIHPDDVPVLTRIRADMAKRGEASGEHRLITKTGMDLWVHTRSKVLPTGDVVLINRDITDERARRVREIQTNYVSELLRSSAGITLWRYDPDLDLYEFGADLSQPMGRKAYDGDVDVRNQSMVARDVFPEDAPELGRRWARSLRRGEPGAFEYRQQGPDGIRHVRTAWTPLNRKASGQWEMLGIIQDVTELAEARDAAIQGAEAAQAAAEAKSQFLANMSHEIRTPLNGVLGVLHLLKNEALSPNGAKLIDEALSCGEMLGQLLNDVIDFSKIEAGRLELDPQPVEIAPTVEGVVSLLRPTAEAKGLQLRTTAPADLGWMAIDPVRLRQMLFNLVGNAVKFTLSGHVEVRLATLGAGDDQRLRVAIEDTGIGIAPEAQAGLFQRFHQADGSTTRRFGGSGLGLSITRRLAELMDGEVGVISQPGQGSTFWFEIAAPAARAPQGEAPADSALLEGVRVLVVEDNATNRLIARHMLENLGAQVETADDGTQGVAAVERSAFDLIFMDVQMPVMDGVEATRAIRALPGPAARTPIIAMTANAMAHQQASYRTAGMNGGVSKPLSPAALLAELGRLFGEGANSESDAA